MITSPVDSKYLFYSYGLHQWKHPILHILHFGEVVAGHSCNLGYELFLQRIAHAWIELSFGDKQPATHMCTKHVSCFKL